MKKIITAMSLLALVATMAITAGCSKREQVLAGAAFLSGLGAGTSVLRGHFKRNDVRKRKGRLSATALLLRSRTQK